MDASGSVGRRARCFTGGRDIAADQTAGNPLQVIVMPASCVGVWLQGTAPDLANLAG
jgi:hypothetical protein